MGDAQVGIAPENNVVVIDVEEIEKSQIEDKFKLLSEMFPNADEAFLQAKSEAYAFDQIGFDWFLENTMFKNCYPIKPVIEEPMPVVKDWSVFSLDAFLEKYPDPINYFTENANGVRYIVHSTNFLLDRFRLISTTVIKSVLKEKKFNLYLAYKVLQGKAESRVVRRRDNEIRKYGKPPDEFYDEVALINNDKEIEQYINDKILARNKAVEEARESNALLICGCCMSDDLLALEVLHCSEGHIFCRTCIHRSTNIAMGDGKTEFPCLQECTGGSFSLIVLQEVLTKKVFDKLLKKIQEKEVAAANIIGLESCPFCEYCAIPPETARIFDCENCGTQSCRSCRKKSHIPFRCDEVKDGYRVHIEEKMTEALLRTCWKCQTKYLREDGCNKMICVCGAQMCYLCRQPISGYDHFDKRGKREERKPCALWTNNEVVHDRAVREAGIRVIKELKRENPGLDLDFYNKKQKM